MPLSQYAIMCMHIICNLHACSVTKQHQSWNSLKFHVVKCRNDVSCCINRIKANQLLHLFFPGVKKSDLLLHYIHCMFVVIDSTMTVLWHVIFYCNFEVKMSFLFNLIPVDFYYIENLSVCFLRY